MKLKHLLLTGVLTTIAAITLLTLVVPQTAEAGPPSFVCHTMGCGISEYHPTTRKIARQLCKDDPHVTYCETEGTQRLVCEGRSAPCD